MFNVGCRLSISLISQEGKKEPIVSIFFPLLLFAISIFRNMNGQTYFFNLKLEEIPIASH